MFRRRTVEKDRAQGRPRGRVTRRRDVADRDPETGREDVRDEAAGRTWRSRGALAAGATVLAIARLIRFVAVIVALIIGAAILLRALDANAGNSIVSAIHDAGKALVGPFDGMFRLHDAKASIAVNWGIALLVYLAIGTLVASYLRRLAVAGRRAGSRALRTRPA